MIHRRQLQDQNEIGQNRFRLGCCQHLCIFGANFLLKRRYIHVNKCCCLRVCESLCERACMRAYVCVCMCVYVCVCVCVCESVFVCVCVREKESGRTRKRVCARTRSCMHSVDVCVYKNLCVGVRVCVRACVCHTHRSNSMLTAATRWGYFRRSHLVVSEGVRHTHTQTHRESVCMFVWVCERVSERGRESVFVRLREWMCVCVCVCVCRIWE